MEASGAHGPTWANWAHRAHGPHGLLGWGTTRRELNVPSGIASRNRYFKDLRALCREFQNSLTSEEGVVFVKKFLTVFVRNSNIFLKEWVVMGRAAGSRAPQAPTNSHVET